MEIEEIHGTAYDLAGGEMISSVLDHHYTAGVVMNVLAGMSAEAANAGHEAAAVMRTISIAANQETGLISDPLTMFRISFARYRHESNDPWRVIDIVDNIAVFTNAQNRHRRVLMFSNQLNQRRWRLSFPFDRAVTVEIWGRYWSERGNTADVEELAETDYDSGIIPKEFGLLAAYRTAGLLLSALLLEGDGKYRDFVIAQRAGQYAAELQRYEYLWRQWLTRPTDGHAPLAAKEFDAREDHWNENDGTHTPNQFRG